MKSKGSKHNDGPQVEVKRGGSLGRVGLIAGLGFILGVVWPRLAGISLVPEAPLEHPEPTSIAKKAVQASTGRAPAEQVTEVTNQQRLKIGEAQLTSCVLTNGKKSKSCGKLQVDDLLLPAIRQLAFCPAADGIFGVLSLGIELDFEKGKVLKLTQGRSTQLPKQSAKDLLACAEQGLAEVKLKQVDTKRAPHSRYQLYYSVEFLTPESIAASQQAVTPASGTATVRWKSAQVRKYSTKEAKVLARLLSGARVVVTGRDGQWYRVKYDAQDNEGWVHGAALGLE